MNLHEYQAKQLFARYRIPVTRGEVAATPAQAGAAADRLGGKLWVVKAQVHAGGRGKAGGVKLARSSEEVRAAAAGMLGSRLKTKQTGAAGLPINLVFVEAGSSIERELYLSMLVDRARQRVANIASAAGISVAYRAKPVVHQQATYALNHARLDGVLAWFGNEARPISQPSAA